MSGFDQTRLQTLCLSFLALLALGALLHVTKSFLVPFVIAVLVSFILHPLADRLVAMKIPSVIANILVILFSLVVLTTLLFIVYKGMHQVASDLDKYMDKYSVYLKQATSYLEQKLGIKLVADKKEWQLDRILRLISPASVMKTVNQGVGTFISMISQTTLMMLFVMFLLSSRTVLIDKVFAFFHAQKGGSGETVRIITDVAGQVQMYLIIKTLISIGTGAVFGLAAYVLGLDFALLWGFIGFLLNFIPTLGPVLACIPPIFVALVQFDSIGWIILVSVSMSAVQFTSGSFVEPLIMGDRLNLNIITILLSLLLWGLIWGLPGMFLAVPITAVLNIICRNIPSIKDVSILLSK